MIHEPQWSIVLLLLLLSSSFYIFFYRHSPPNFPRSSGVSFARFAKGALTVPVSTNFSLSQSEITSTSAFSQEEFEGKVGKERARLVTARYSDSFLEGRAISNYEPPTADRLSQWIVLITQN